MASSSIRTYNKSFFAHNDLNTKCHSFVKKICAKRQNDSHSVAHMERVVETCTQILKNDFAGYPGYFWSVTILSAWLHDVKDHKYPEEDNDNQLSIFLKSLDLQNVLGFDYSPYILKIIDYVSFSKENSAIMAGAPLDFEKILSDEKCPLAHHARNIVSDADKLDASGRNGVSRCVSTAIELYVKKNGVPPSLEELKKRVNAHANEKLLILERFMRTPTGKKLYEKAHEEFVYSLQLYNQK